MARRGGSFLDELFNLSVKMPWWLSLVFAFSIYLFCRHLAGGEVGALSQLGHGGYAGQQMVKIFASFAQYALPAVFVLGAVVSLLRSTRRARLFSSVARSAVPKKALESITWQQFEQVIGEAFRRQGYRVEETANGADGGVDLVLFREGEKALVQCKQWKSVKVSVNVVRELFGVMAAEGASWGFVVTSGEFTKDAKAFARGRNVRLIDGAVIRQWMSDNRLPPPATEETVGEVRSALATVRCPRCGGVMQTKVAKKGSSAGKLFWSCAHFPRCRGARPL